MPTHQAKLGMAWYFPLLKKITNNYCRKSNTTKIQNKIELIVSVSLWSDPINSSPPPTILKVNRFGLWSIGVYELFVQFQTT